MSQESKAECHSENEEKYKEKQQQFRLHWIVIHKQLKNYD